MAVTIDLDLNAAGVEGEILAVASALETLDAAANDLEIDLDSVNVDEISGEIGNMVEMLEGLELDLSDLDEKLTRIENLDDIEIEANVNTPDGSTNSGDSQGKPVINTGGFLDAQKKAVGTTDGGDSGGFGDKALATKIEDFLGFDRGSVEIFDDVDTDALDEMAADIEMQARNLTDEQYPWHMGDDDRQPGMKGFLKDFHSDLDKSDYMDMDWDEIRGRASEAGVYNRGDTKEDLAGKLAAQNFAGQKAAVRTDDGLVSLNTAFRKKQGDFDRGFFENEDGELEGLQVPTEQIDLSDTQEDIAQVAAEQKLRNMKRQLGIEEESENRFDTGGYDFTDFNQQAKYDDFGYRRDDVPTEAELRQQIRENRVAGLDRTADDPGDAPLGGFDPDRYRDFKRESMDIPDTDLRESNLARKTQTIEEFKENFDGFGSKLKRFKPTMGKYMQLLAAMIPIAVALGTQLLGVAAAMGAIGAAGAGVLGLGLLGHAESLEGSMAQAKQQIQDLKQEMFDVFQPAMQQFAPIQARAFDAIPGAMEGISEEIEGLESFEDTLFNLGGALAGGMQRAVEIINENEEAISQLSERFGGLLGGGLLNFFEWLIQAASENQDMLVEVGRAMLDLAVIGYNLSMMITRILGTLSPLISLFEYLSGYLQNDLVLGVVTFITMTYVLIAALSKLGIAALSAFSKVGLIGSKSFMMQMATGLGAIHGQITALIGQYTALSAAATKAAAAIAMTGIGALAVAGGGLMAADVMSQSSNDSGAGMGRGPGGDTYNDNRSFKIVNNGDMDYSDRKGIEDTVKQVGEEKSSRTPPKPDSDGSNNA